MVKSAFLITGQERFPCNLIESTNKVVFEDVTQKFSQSFDIEISFSESIKEFRDHNYTWTKSNDSFISNEFCPKILRLENGIFIQANQNAGIWESRIGSNILLWRFNPRDSAPLTVYSGAESEKKITDSAVDYNFTETPALLFSYENAIEFSRSPIPFSAIACFTDHCDYDTLQSLEIQREFFKANSIKVTKGFFMYHYSKRDDNASFERNADELDLWRKDGHELAYHSLSQSIRDENEAGADFNELVPPYSDLTTWIDHGYQPYNFSLFQRNNFPVDRYSNKLAELNIRNLWNYIDSGTATNGAINQLNPSHFTLEAFASGNSDLSFIDRIKLLVKNIIFHHYADEKQITEYKSAAGKIKSVVKNKSIAGTLSLVKSLFTLAMPILRVFLNWNSEKKKVYRLAKYTPLIFKHKIGQQTFNVFQTIEMVDFKKALHASNIEMLIAEKGLFIGHTYFAAPMEYHHGKLFRTPTQIDPEVARNFELLGQKIKDGQIWNPTLNELVEFLANFEHVILDVDDDGVIKVVNASGLPYRSVN